MTSPLRLCVRRSPEPGAAVTVSLSVPTDVDCIEEAVALVTRHCLAGTEAGPQLRFRLQVSLSEALANAMLRGNRQDPAKHVEVAVELDSVTIRIRVTDQGGGFDPSAVPEPLAPSQILAGSGRGLFLIRSLVDAVEFNERGNSICMLLRRR